MIEAMKDDQLVVKVGGRFKLCTLIQRRLQQLLDGDRPLIDRGGRSDLEVVFEEIRQDLITLEFVGGDDADAELLARNEALL
ncbi:MAG: DNA-directed RNA polymerase subunit omega [Phycisphaerales bacterium]|nr:DNA-directed RNA polymerase subunit omega [Phycisphaerales bacterium]